MTQGAGMKVVGALEALEMVSPKLAKALEWFMRNQDVIFDILGQFLEGSALEANGWLPHPILSTLKVADFESPDLRSVVELHYRSNWLALKNALLLSSVSADVDQSAKEVFDDAIALHEMGQYRAVCRLIFPELERLVRRELMGQRRGAATKLKALRKRLGQLPASAHTADAGSRPLYVLAALEAHLFEDVNSDEALQKFEASGIPNRHACIHGLIDYNSFQNSMNMLILASYCYSAIGRVRHLPDLSE